MAGELKSRIEHQLDTIYRSRDGMIFGVCRGFAEAQDLSVGWVRIGAIVISTITGFWPAIILYLVAAMLMKVEPVLPLKTSADEEFYSSYSTSRPMALRRLKGVYDNLDMRIQRIENAVTARDYDWDERLNG